MMLNSSWARASSSIASAEFTKSQLKEWMKPVEARIPKFLAASGHKGVVYREEPYGVTLGRGLINAQPQPY
jgi:aldehyde dehydrogenase (NAD+)